MYSSTNPPKSIQADDEMFVQTVSDRWKDIVAEIDFIDQSSEAVDVTFEDVCRKIWAFASDEKAMQAMEFDSFQQMVQNDPDIRRLLDSPTIKHKIVVSSYQNINRFENLLYWDSLFPSLNILRSPHLTTISQRAGIAGKMSTLIANCQRDGFSDYHIRAAQSIMMGEMGTEPEKTHLYSEKWADDRFSILIDGIEVMSMPRDIASRDLHAIRLRSKLMYKFREGIWIDKESHSVMGSNNAGTFKFATLLTDDEDILEYMSGKGIKIK